MNESSGRLVIKYGGNAMTDESLRRDLLNEISKLHKAGHSVILVHGGGPEIQRLLKLAKIESEFVEGHRRTTEEIMYFVQLALRGEVNGSLVRILNHAGTPAVGISGKDGGMVSAIKRYHITGEADGEQVKADIGYVGDVDHINPELILKLSESGFLPVIAPIALGSDGFDYNINADIFAGAIAAAVKADQYISLTNVNGLYEHFPDENSRLEHITLNQLREFMVKSAAGGMLPKLESIRQALENGVEAAHIVNGTNPEAMYRQITGEAVSGTLITKT